MSTRSLLLALLALGACGGEPPRIRALYVTTDGVRYPFGFIDSKLKIRCQWEIAEDRWRRCMPAPEDTAEAVQGRYFCGSATRPAYGRSGMQLAREPGRDGLRIWTVTEVPQPDLDIYPKSFCAAQRPDPTPGAWYALGGIVQSNTFALGDEGL